MPDSNAFLGTNFFGKNFNEKMPLRLEPLVKLSTN
jgi:hypothetical protein